MTADLKELARNALGCLDLKEGTGKGQELYVIYNGSNPFKEELAQAMLDEARRLDVRGTGLDIDRYLVESDNNDRVMEAVGKAVLFDVSNPLQRNAINMIGHGGRYEDVRRRITKGLFINENKTYVLQMPFDKPSTAEALLSANPGEMEPLALRIKADLCYNIISSGG